MRRRRGQRHSVAAACDNCESLVQWAKLRSVDVAVGLRCGDGSGVRVVLCIPILPGNGGDHGIYARTYVSLADVQEEEGHDVCNMYRFVTGQLCNVAGVFVWPE